MEAGLATFPRLLLEHAHVRIRHACRRKDAVPRVGGIALHAGLLEGGHEFYTVDGAFALRDVLANFAGGRVVVGVTSTPFKCPPAPSETALLVDDFLTARGLRTASEVSLVMPMGMPIPPSPCYPVVERLWPAQNRQCSPWERLLPVSNCRM